MRRRLNGRFLLFLIAGALLLGGSVHVLHGMQVKRSATTLLALADEAGERARRDDEINYLTRYLAFRPDDVEALARFGNRLDDRADSNPSREQAIRIYERVIRLAPDRDEIRRRLVELNLELGRFSGAKLHAEILAPSAPEDGTIKYYLGRCAEGGGRYHEAAEYYRESLKLDSPPIEAFTSLAALLRTRFNNAAEADSVMDAQEVGAGLIANHPDSASAYLARHQYRKRYGLNGADEDLARALELGPDSTDVLLSAAASAQGDAEAAQVSGDLDRATVEVEKALQLLTGPDGSVKDPNNPAFYQALSRVESLAGRPREAIAWLTRGVEALPEETGLRIALAEAHIQASDVPGALRLVEQLDQDGLSSGWSRYLRGRLHMAEADWGEAAAALEEAREEIGLRSDLMSKNINILLAQCYTNQGDLSRAHGSYRRAVDIALSPDPYWAAARLGLASTLASTNRIDEALREYQILLPRYPAAGPIMARMLIEQNLRRPEDRRDWQQVEQVLLATEAATPGARKAEVITVRVEALSAQGKLDEARALVMAALPEGGDAGDLWIVLSNIDFRDNKPEEALAVLDEARGRLGDRVELRLARIAHWAHRGGEAAESNLAELGGHLEAYEPEDRSRLRKALASAYLRLGNLDEAKARWDDISREQPDDLDSQLVRLDLAMRSGDEPGAERVVERIRDIEGPDGPLGNYGEARLLMRVAQDGSKHHEGELARADRLLASAADRRPFWSPVTIARAQVAELTSNQDGAIDLYLKAILEQGDRNADAIYRVFGLLHRRQRSREADSLFRRLRAEQVPLSTELQQFASQISTANKDYQQALELAQQAVSERSENPAELIWLAEKRWAAGEDAEPLLRRAVEVNAEDPTGWVALVTYLARTDRRDSALEAIRSAEQSLPEGAAGLALARCYEEVGDREQARRYYEAALPGPLLSARVEDIPTLRAVATFYLRGNHRMEAEELLGRMIDLGGETSDASWARRVKASILAAGGNRGVIEALELLDSDGFADQHDAQAVPEDLRVKARILAIQPNRAHRKHAMSMLETLISDGVATIDDRFLLARLWEADGDWDRAGSEIRSLLEQAGDNPAILAYYIRSLLRHEAPGLALETLERLEASVPPGQPLVLELRARALHALGRNGEAVALLRDYARSHEDRSGAVAILLEQLGEVAPAEEMIRRYIDSSRPERPEAVLTLATFLGRHGRIEESIRVLEQAWTTCPPEAVANASVQVLYGMTKGDEHAERVAMWLEDAVQKHPEKVSIRFDLANVRALQGRYGDAESIFREIHEGDKTVGAPLNNLAWMLALRGGKGGDALSYAQKAIGLEGETPDLLDTRALAYLALNQPGPAIQDLENALAIAKDNVEMLFHLALAYRMAGKVEDAADAFGRARSLGLTASSLHPLERGNFEHLSKTATQESATR